MSLPKKTLAVVLFLTIGPVALGQSYRGFREESEAIARNAKLSLGPIRFYPGLSLKNVGYDDNIYFEGPPVSDYGGTISPSINAYLPFRNSLILSFTDNPEYVFFLKQKSQRTFTNSYSLGLKYLLFQRFVLSAGYQRSEYREPVSSELFRPTTNVTRRFKAGFFYETARRTSIGVTWDTVSFGYRSLAAGGETLPLSQTLDRQEKTASLEFYYQLYPESFFFMKLGHTEYEFADVQSAGRNASSSYGLVGIRFPLVGFIRGLLSVGYRRFLPAVEGKKAFTGFFGDTGLDIRRGKFGVRFRYGRDIFFSYHPDSYYFIDHNYGAGLSCYPTEFLRFDYDYSRRIMDYSEIVRQDTQTGHSVGFVIRIYRDIGLGLTWNFSRWTSTPLGFDRKRNFLGATLTYQF